jgi:hypothetical protein
MTETRPVPMWASHQHQELSSLVKRDQVALIEGEYGASRRLLDLLGDALRAEPCSVSVNGLIPTPARTSGELLDRLGRNRLLYDLEAICWQPWLRIDPLRFLKVHARKAGVIAIWPGIVHGHIASFSAPGRNDYVTFNASGIRVLRPVQTRFPDEVPFTVERIAA